MSEKTQKIYTPRTYYVCRSGDGSCQTHGIFRSPNGDPSSVMKTDLGGFYDEPHEIELYVTPTSTGKWNATLASACDRDPVNIVDTYAEAIYCALYDMYQQVDEFKPGDRFEVSAQTGLGEMLEFVCYSFHVVLLDDPLAYWEGLQQACCDGIKEGWPLVKAQDEEFERLFQSWVAADRPTAHGYKTRPFAFYYGYGNVRENGRRYLRGLSYVDSWPVPNRLNFGVEDA